MSSVLAKVVVPAESIVMAAPVPDPIPAPPPPTAALNTVASATSRTRFCAPSTAALTVNVSPASIVSIVTTPPESVT